MSDTLSLKQQDPEPHPDDAEAAAAVPEKSSWRPLSGLRRLGMAFSDSRMRRANAAAGNDEWSETWTEERPGNPLPADLLAEARDALKQAIDAHAAEHAIAEELRHELEERLNEKRADSRIRQDLEADLDEARRQLRRAVDTHSTEARVRQDALKAAAEELMRVEAALAMTQTERQAALDGHATERATWTEARQQLEAVVNNMRGDLARAAEAHDAECEARANERQAAADARAGLQEALDAAGHERAENQQVIELYQSEEANWNVTRQALEGRIEAMGHAHADLEAAVADAQTSLRQQSELHAAERGEWETRQHETEAALNAAGAELKESAAARAADQAALAATRNHLDLRVNELQALGVTHAKAEQALNITAAQLQQTTDQYASDRVAWEAARQQFETDLARTREELARLAEVHDAELRSRVEERQHAADARAELESEVAKARAESQRAVDAYVSEGAAWDNARRQLEADLDGARAMHQTIVSERDAEREAHGHELREAGAARATLQEALEATHRERQELQHVIENYQAEQTAWNASRHEFEKRIESMGQAHANLETALAESHASLSQHVDRHAAERADWDARQHQIEAALSAAGSELKEVSDARSAEQEALAATRHLLDQRQNELQELTAAHARAEQTLEGTAAQLQQATDGHTAASAAWEETRQHLEREAARAESETARAESETVRAREELTQRHEAHHAELHARAEELQQLTQARAGLEDEVARTRAELQRIIEASEADRAGWSQTRHELEERLRQIESADGERHQLQQALDAARAGHAELLSTYASLERQLAETTSRLRQQSAESEALRQRNEPESQSDIRTELEERLQQARRLEEVGRLAGAMAPDIKQLVSSIDQCGAELSGALDASDPRRKPAQAIVTLSRRASGLLRQLLTFSEKQSRPLTSVDVNDCVRHAEPVLARLMGAGVDLKFQLCSSGVISAGGDDVEHLVTALVFSARDLLPVGGSLVIETRRVEDLDTDKPDAGATGHLVLTVSAAGYGVRPAQASSALELAAQRCTGELYFDGTPDRAVLEVRFALARVDAVAAPPAAGVTDRVEA